MAVNINASTSSGLIQSADTSGILQLQSNGTTQFTVSSTGSYGQLKSGTAVASTSGTAIDFTSIPSWVKRITVQFVTVSTNGTNYYMLQVGSGSVSTSSYSGVCSQLNTGSMTTGVATNGFMITYDTTTAAPSYSGNIVITLTGSNTWTSTGSLGRSDGALYTSCGVSPALGGALDRIRITTNGGTNTFDAGSINILYEG
jgi:hypothetical protein